jgi:hypothetical protein
MSILQQTPLNWTDAIALTGDEACAYTGPTAEESEFVITPVLYGESEDETPAFYYLKRRAEGVPGGFAECGEFDSVELAKAAATEVLNEQQTNEEQRKLQDRYLTLCEFMEFGDSIVVDCKFPMIRVAHLRKGLYPQLNDVMSHNLQVAIDCGYKEGDAS